MVLSVINVVRFFIAPRFVFGLLPPIKARKLSEEQLEKIKKYGLSHCTTMLGYEGINREKKIHASKGDTAYSNQNKPCVFFCINSDDGATKGINSNEKYRKKLIIKGFNEQQLSLMKIRNCDKAIIYQGDIDISDLKVEWMDVKSEKLPLKRQLVMLFDIKNDYYRTLWIDIGIEILICFFIAILFMLGIKG